jgi:hypothetical protein
MFTTSSQESERVSEAWQGFLQVENSYEIGKYIYWKGEEIFLQLKENFLTFYVIKNSFGTNKKKTSNIHSSLKMLKTLFENSHECLIIRESHPRSTAKLSHSFFQSDNEGKLRQHKSR